jgi:hypothetical protein
VVVVRVGNRAAHGLVERARSQLVRGAAWASGREVRDVRLKAKRDGNLQHHQKIPVHGVPHRRLALVAMKPSHKPPCPRWQLRSLLLVVFCFVHMRGCWRVLGG